ncbi:hypothetical protein GQX74_009745 [Glossina fuscipes]|nr:hypothetical protein GQX74_009745 [Glossina fuscipes]
MRILCDVKLENETVDMRKLNLLPNVQDLKICYILITKFGTLSRSMGRESLNASVAKSKGVRLLLPSLLLPPPVLVENSNSLFIIVERPFDARFAGIWFVYAVWLKAIFADPARYGGGDGADVDDDLVSSVPVAAVSVIDEDVGLLSQLGASRAAASACLLILDQG